MAPEIAVVVASHDRPLRLRWLLEALADQTLARDRFEVVVAHDSSGPETDQLLEDHALARDGTLAPRAPRPGVEPARRQSQRRLARRASADRRLHRRRLPPAARVAGQRAARRGAPPRRHRPGRHPARPRRAPPALRARPPQAEHRAAHGLGPDLQHRLPARRARAAERLRRAPPRGGGRGAGRRRPRARRRLRRRARRAHLPRRRPGPAAALPALAAALGGPAAAGQGAPGDAPPLPARPVLEVDARVAARSRCSEPRWPSARPSSRSCSPCPGPRRRCPGTGRASATSSSACGRPRAASPSTPPRWRCWPAGSLRHRAPLL